MLKKFRMALVFSLAVMMMCFMSVPAFAGSSGKAVKVRVSITSLNRSEQMTVTGLNRSKKAVWKYTTKKYPHAQIDRTLCKVRGNKVYIFDGSKLRIVKKSTGKKIGTIKDITMGGHVVGFDKKGNLYVTGFLNTVLYKISPKGRLLWKTDYYSTGKYWAYKIIASSTSVTVVCDASDSNPGESGNYKVVFSAASGKIR